MPELTSFLCGRSDVQSCNRLVNTPFNIGKLRIASRALAAPMAGLSLPAFRKLLMELGCGLAFTEMVSAEGVVYANERTKQYYENNEGIQPHAVQFFTSKPDMLKRAVEIIESQPPSPLPLSRQGRGNNESPQKSAGIDLFDLNMGCPVKKIVKKGSGSALMKTPKLAAELVEALKDATAKPVTVKIRAGWDDRSINCVEFAKTMEDAGADAVSVHPRTRAQEFRGSANWDLIAAVKDALKIPVIGNGDIKTADDAQRMMDETGCDATMIGRAAYRNPWIFAEIAGMDSRAYCPHSKKEMVLRYVELLQESRDERHVIYAMRSFLSRFAKGHEGTSKFMTTVHQITNVPELKQTIKEFSFNSTL